MPLDVYKRQLVGNVGRERHVPRHGNLRIGTVGEGIGLLIIVRRQFILCLLYTSSHGIGILHLQGVVVRVCLHLLHPLALHGDVGITTLNWK